MTGTIRYSLSIGLSALFCLGALGPVVAVGETPSPGTSTASPTDPVNPATVKPSQSTSYKLDPSKFSLLVTPTRLVLGAQDLLTTHDFSLVNRGHSPLVVGVQKRNFVAKPDGSLDYQQDAAYGAANWLSVSPANLRINPGETQVVSVTVRVPAKPEPGDHQVAVVFLVPAGKTSANIKINRGVAVPVYLTVPGAINNTVNLDSLQAAGFALRGPVAVTATLSNVGTVHRDFRKPSPLTVQASGSADPFPDFTVPRGASRDISTTWDPPLVCLCRVQVDFANPGAPPQSATVHVIVFPWDLLVAVVGALLLILLLGWIVRRRFRAQVTKAAAAQSASPTADG